MNKYVLILILLFIVLIVYMDLRFEKLELAIAQHNTSDNLDESSFQMYLTNIYIEKVEGNGNAFGDNNKIENTGV